jgi:hypothetical protein
MKVYTRHQFTKNQKVYEVVKIINLIETGKLAFDDITKININTYDGNCEFNILVYNV